MEQEQTEYFTMKNRADFENFIAQEDVVQVNFEAQFERLYEAGEYIFIECEDAYGFVRKKKGFGLSKAKTELYFFVYEKGFPERWKSKESDSASKLYKELHAKGFNFYNKKGITSDS